MKSRALLGGIAVLAVVAVGALATTAVLAQTLDSADSQGWGHGTWGAGMMSGQGGMMGTSGGMMGGAGMMGSGMMGSGGMMGTAFGESASADPLSVTDARAAVEDYLATLDNSDLAVGQALAFTNNAYAQVMEKSTGRGAFEVLVDPVTGRVFPEPGPNVMWNEKYGHMAAQGSSGMMGQGACGDGAGVAADPNASAEMPVTPDQAVEAAQRYLDTNLPGARAGGVAATFYGYYTLYFARDGALDGMLSVQGRTGQVFVHTWHATPFTEG